MRLYIIRHADPDYENGTITHQGHLEAQALARRLAEYRIDTVVSSPLGRAQDTARYTAEALALPVQTEAWLTELDLRLTDGALDGRAAWNVPADRIRAPMPLDLERQWEQVPELSEHRISQRVASVAAASDRFLSHLGYVRDRYQYRIEHRNDRQIAVFCHNGLGLTWLSLILGIPTALFWSSFWLSPSSVSTVLFEEHPSGTATPRCLCVGDTSHLAAGELPVQTGGLTVNRF